MYPGLQHSIAGILPEVASLPQERKDLLRPIADFVRQRRADGVPVDLVFICTHNARRSILAQVWAATAAEYFGIEGIRTWSGGAEVTVVSPNVTGALLRAGFRIEGSGDENSEMAVHMDDHIDPVVCFSKLFDDPFNPREGFAAVMVCTEDGGEACPFVPKADARFGLPYGDPKSADDLAVEKRVYDERSREIAGEMLYLFSLLK